VKELLKSDSICQSFAQIKKGPVFDSQSIKLSQHWITNCLR